jgi:hypothetical protein
MVTMNQTTVVMLFVQLKKAGTVTVDLNLNQILAMKFVEMVLISVNSSVMMEMKTVQMVAAQTVKLKITTNAMEVQQVMLILATMSAVMD